MTLVAFQFVPGAYSLFEVETIYLWALGIFAGYLPGIVVCWAALRLLNRRSARLVGAFAAATTAALIAGFAAMFFAAGAYV
jgi:hypothetical protein